MDLNMICLAAKETQPGTALGLGPAWVQAAEACHKIRVLYVGTVPLAHVHVTMKASRVRKCFALMFLNILQWLAASHSWRSMCFSASTHGPPEAAGAHH